MFWLVGVDRSSGIPPLGYGRWAVLGRNGEMVRFWGLHRLRRFGSSRGPGTARVGECVSSVGRLLRWSGSGRVGPAFQIHTV
jgi:hypothetical protein